MSNLKDNTKDWVWLDPDDFTFYITDGEEYPYMVVCKETGFCVECETKEQALREKRNPGFDFYDERYLFENGLI
mgnify:CR=1 FL=1|jgi:hypothetical protein|tara:strand:- start:223 stop:444 length:222 start_codon:yes stop_codon:yes gene_type:complete